MVTAMREMKDSGAVFLGSVPMDWHTDKVKYHLERYEVRNPGDQQILSVYREYGVIPKDSRDDNHNVTSEDTTKYKYVKPGYFVINKMKAWQGSMGVSDHEGVVSPAYYIYRFQDCLFDKKYFHYLLRGCYKDEFRRLSGGIREGQWDLPSQAFENTIVLVPDILEQKAIVGFLDSKCAEIDALSDEIQSEIDTLEEYKRSIITEAVTKGLDKTVPMKDSGVEWVGEIPDNWVMQRGKYVFEQKSDRGNLKSLVLLSPTQNYGVIPQDLYEELSGFSAVKLNEKTDLNSLKTVHKGAFVISLRSFQGGFEYSEYEGVVSPAYQVFYPTIPVCDRYYKYLFKTQIFIDKMNSYTMSLRDGKNIAFADFGRTYIPIPPLDEQASIANYLNDISSQLNDVLAKKQEQLSVLDYYKKSIIYEYVTGKKEVPNGNF